jgi:hypothetical protein
MKTSKTLAMLKTLGENPKLKFKLAGQARKCNTNIIGIGENGNIDWYNEQTQQFDHTFFRIYGTLDWEWEPYQEPVDFIAAVNSGKKIRPAGQGYSSFACIDAWLNSFTTHNEHVALKLINGKWEIEP